MKTIITPEGIFTGMYLSMAIVNAVEGDWIFCTVWLVMIPIYLLIVGAIKIKWGK